MHIEMWPIGRVKPYDKNPRVNDHAVDAVARSLEQFGFKQPIVVDADGVIIVGHTRWKAAMKLGLPEVPVLVAKDLDPVKARAYRIADNQTAAIADWNLDLLPLELRELEALDFDLSLLGFPDNELAEIMAPAGNAGLTDPDDVPEPPEAATTQPGDLWVLGNHRLLCGDSSKAEDVDRLLDGARVHLVCTDPPYNVKVEPRSNNAFVKGETTFHPVPDGRAHARTNVKGTTKRMRAKDRPLANDCVSDEEFGRLLRAWFGNMARVLEPGRGFYIWGGYANLGNYPPVLAAAEMYFSQALVWVKEHPVLTRKDFMGNFELAFYGWREGAAHQFHGPNNVPDTWHVKKVSPQRMIHLTQKPVELSARALAYSSKPGENVLDLFGGSGSTLIACEQQGRRGFLMELDAPYCDVIVQRWEAFAGAKAKRRDAGGAEQPGLPAPAAALPAEKTPAVAGVGGAG